jgi:succinoglycan biosynthesis transport protein ExoP
VNQDLRHDFKAYPTPTLQLNDSATENGESALFSPLNAIRRHRMAMAAIVLSLTVGVGAIVVEIPSRYDSTASVVLQTRPGKLNNMQAVAAEREIDPSLIGTEAEILRSPELARRVTKGLELANVAEFGGSPRGIPALIAKVSGSFSDSTPQAAGAGGIETAVTERLIKAIAITNDPRSYVLSITARSASPILSAAIANAYASAYLNFSRERKADSIRRADEMLDTHLSDLNLRATASERAAEEYRQKNGLNTQFSPRAGGNSTVEGQQLAEINSQLALASDVRADKEANLRQISELARSGHLDSAPQVLSSVLVGRLREQESELAATEAAMADRINGSSPLLTSTRAKLAEVRKSISSELSKIVGGVASEADAAREREGTLLASLRRLRNLVDDQGSAGIKLKELETQAAADRAVYVDFLTQARITANTVNMQVPDAELVSLARIPVHSSYPQRLLIIAMTFLGTSVLGIFVAVALDRKEVGFRSAEEFEYSAGFALLGLLPHAKRRRRGVLTLAAQLPLYREMVNMVRGGLTILDPSGRRKIVLVTSTVPAEGKTTFAVSMALSLAQAGKRVLLVDCDLRRPSVATMLGLKGDGLNALYRMDATLQPPNALAADNLASVITETQSGVHVVPVSPGLDNSQDLLADGRLKTLLHYARSRYDIILLDSPPVMSVVDALVLATLADQAILAVRWRKTPRALVLRTIEILRGAGLSIGGAVMTQVNTKQFARGHMGRDAFMYSQYLSYYTRMS